MAKFQIFKDIAGGYRWRLRAPNGEVIATSGESYVYKSGAESAVQRIKTYAPVAVVEDLT